ncbi:Tyrosine--tRNA ligase [bacterium HR35]|nr:Tyrosine--tRNA ligase [bacterium HR35]
MDFLTELKKRNLIYQATPNIEEFFKKKGTLYLGVDPTSDSLHLGNYLGLSLLKRFYLNGFNIIIILGGGTAKIGDPSGKLKERPILPLDVLEKNKKKIRKQILKFLPIDNKKVKLIDNSKWLDNLKLMEFLRDIGKFMSVNSMLDLEFVKERLNAQEMLSFAEFTYQLLQAYDFYVLFEKYGCQMQIGGSDQWGNIIQGIELIRKKTNQEAYGLVYPLLIDPKTGRKFGKTEAGETLWLDPQKFHPFRMYQFLINLDDDLAKNLLYFYSFKKLEEIEKIIEEGEKNKELRIIQKKLAEEIVISLYGEKVFHQVSEITNILFNKNFEDITLKEIKILKDAIPTKKFNKNTPLEEILVELNLAKSKSEARNLLNNVKVLERGGYLLIKKGKKDFGLAEF